MGFDGLPIFLVEHLQSIAKREGFADGYDVRHEAGSKVGDGFMATMLSVTLVGDRRKEPTANLEWDELALICKLQPTSAARQDIFSSERVFRCEVHMYQTVLPAFVEFQKSHGVSEDVVFNCFPKCFAAFHEDGNSESVIILQDIRQTGYEMWNKKRPTQYAGVRLLMEQLGRFHGLSFAIRDQNPKLFLEFQDKLTDIVEVFAKPPIVAIVNGCTSKVIPFVEDSEDLQALQRIANNWQQFVSDAVNVDLLGNFGVINHGDCWNNNMMYELKEEVPKSIVLLDWQMSRITSPAIDLSYYLFSSTVKSLRDAHLDEFLKIYYTNLADVIRATGSDPEVLFPEEELQRQLRQFGKIGVLMAPILIPAMLADSSDITDLDSNAEQLYNKKTSDRAVNISGNKEQEFIKRMQDVVSDARRYGWL